MKYNELQATKSKSSRRVGRGISAGKGKTAGRGTKGQKSRAGSTRRLGFEGGQNPLMQRLPKLRGFKSHKPAIETVYTGDLDSIKGTIDNFSLSDAGLVTSPYVKVKLIVRGDISNKHSVKLQFASSTAIEMLKKAGGSFEQVDQVKRTSSKTKED